MSQENELVFLKDNGLIFPGINRNKDLLDHLPAAVYKPTYVMKGNEPVLALATMKEKFKLPEKIYGATNEEVYRLLIDDFKNNPRGTSAMIHGHKGAGKSLIAHRIANYFIQLGMPVLYYEKAFNPEELQRLIPLIGQCCIICEEFLKHAADRDDEGNVKPFQPIMSSFLTLLSNNDLPKYCMIFLDNDTAGLSDFMVNRPDRIRWMIEYTMDRLEIYDEMVKDEPIIPELKDYLRVYFSNFVVNSGGFDVMDMVVKKARNVMSIREFVAKMKYWNVPPVKFPSVSIMLDEIWNERRKAAMYTNAGVDLFIVDSTTKTFPVVKLSNHESNYLDKDQEMEVDFNELLTEEWFNNRLNGKGSQFVSINDIEFAVAFTTALDVEPDMEINRIPVKFSIVPPAVRDNSKNDNK